MREAIKNGDIAAVKKLLNEVLMTKRGIYTKGQYLKSGSNNSHFGRVLMPITTTSKDFLCYI